MGCDASMKYMSRTITMQGFTIAAIISVEKHTLIILNINFDSQWTLKCRSRVLEEYVKEDYYAVSYFKLSLL